MAVQLGAALWHLRRVSGALLAPLRSGLVNQNSSDCGAARGSRSVLLRRCRGSSGSACVSISLSRGAHVVRFPTRSVHHLWWWTVLVGVSCCRCCRFVGLFIAPQSASWGAFWPHADKESRLLVSLGERDQGVLCSLDPDKVRSEGAVQSVYYKY